MNTVHIMHQDTKQSPCPGCGGVYAPIDGSVHPYMDSSPACFAAFNTLLVAEYSGYEDPALRDVHRLTVDTWAVQHPGDPADRRAIQSVGMHLARLFLQLEQPRPPAETNQVMLDFSRHKATLPRLQPPLRFSITAGDIAPFAGTPQHAAQVRAWAEATWQDWSHQHTFILDWVSTHSTLAR